MTSSHGGDGSFQPRGQWFVTLLHEVGIQSLNEQEKDVFLLCEAERKEANAKVWNISVGIKRRAVVSNSLLFGEKQPGCAECVLCPANRWRVEADVPHKRDTGL